MLYCIVFLFLSVFPADTVQQLKEQSRANLARMNNVIAHQDLKLWGGGMSRQQRYQTAIYNGRQTFKIGKEIVSELPLPAVGVRPGAAWYEFIRQLPFLSLRQESDRVFTYTGNCYWREPNFADWVPCEGRIETDAEFNVLRMSQVLHPPGIVREVETTVTYSWTRLLGCRLLPRSLQMSAVYRNGWHYFASATWKKYQMFYTGELVARDDVGDESEPIAEQGPPPTSEAPHLTAADQSKRFMVDTKTEVTRMKIDSKAKRLLKRFRLWSN